MNDLETIRDLSRQLQALDEAIVTAEDALSDLVAKRREIAENQLPGLMDSLEIEMVTTDDGLVVTVEDYFTASASKRNMPAVLKQLDRLNSLDIVKHEIRVPLTKEMSEKAMELMSDLQSQGYDARNVQDINTSTLKAFVKEQIKKGELSPSDLPTFGVHEVRRAKIRIK